ncbi:MAG: DivIVA domain-containing protein [Acidimicrobiia bacterium]
MADLSSHQIRNAQFRSSLRGVDRAEVEAFLDQVAERIDDLEALQRKLIAQVDESSGRDLETEFDSIGREVSGILQAAREASESIRERASVDATRWRSEAMAEADTNRKQAAADAEALRRDAWTSGSELLQQSMAEANKIREQAERDVLTTMGEAEREAHRLTSTARREAEDMMRLATMDAEKMGSEATKRRDEIIEHANRQASTAQERTRALEQRRDELLEELENVRSTLTRLEGSLEEKRDALDLTSSPEQFTSVRVVPAQAVDIENWTPGETVRIVRSEDEESDTFDIVDDREPEPDTEPEPEPDTEPEPEPDTEPEPELVTPPEPELTTPAEDDDVGALFASLRGGGKAMSREPATPTESQAPTASVSQAAKSSDWMDDRDARLLPITNRALRGIKKAITELQNIALDSLRTEDSWRPDRDTIEEALHADLVGLWGESFAAGHAVAEEMTESKIKRPKTPPSEAGEFVAALEESVTAALNRAGAGQRERQSAASKTFRVWRTDEAERRIREIAIKGYELGIEASVHVEA